MTLENAIAALTPSIILFGIAAILFDLAKERLEEIAEMEQTESGNTKLYLKLYSRQYLKKGFAWLLVSY